MLLLPIDLYARRIAMSSMAYYGLGISPMPDSEFDNMCDIVANCFDQLSPERRFALGSAEALRTGGSHVRITTAAASGCVAWLERLGVIPPFIRVIATDEPIRAPFFGDWRPCSSFALTAR